MASKFVSILFLGLIFASVGSASRALLNSTESGVQNGTDSDVAALSAGDGYNTSAVSCGEPFVCGGAPGGAGGGGFGGGGGGGGGFSCGGGGGGWSCGGGCYEPVPPTPQCCTPQCPYGPPQPHCTPQCPYGPPQPSCTPQCPTPVPVPVPVPPTPCNTCTQPPNCPDCGNGYYGGGSIGTTAEESDKSKQDGANPDEKEKNHE